MTDLSNTCITVLYVTMNVSTLGYGTHLFQVSLLCCLPQVFTLNLQVSYVRH